LKGDFEIKELNIWWFDKFCMVFEDSFVVSVGTVEEPGSSCGMEMKH
jgi:hypothetical protein